MFINDSYVDNIKTKDLVDLGQSMQGVDRGPHHVRHRPDRRDTPTSTATSTLRDDDIRALFDAIINDDPLPEETNADNTPVPGTPESLTNDHRVADQAAPTPTTTEHGEMVDAVTTDPTTVTVQVSNSTGQDGLGVNCRNANCSSTASTSTTPDDYPGPLHSTTVFFSPGNEEAAATVASAFAEPTIERVDGNGRRRPGGARLRLLHGEPPPPERIVGAGPRAARHRHAHRPNCPRTCRSPTPPTPPASSRGISRVWAGGIHLSFTLHIVTIRPDQPVGWAYANRVPRAAGRPDRTSSARCAGWRGSRWSARPRPCCRPTWCWPNR